eukprot:3762457-Amphidinium_carterae.1
MLGEEGGFGISPKKTIGRFIWDLHGFEGFGSLCFDNREAFAEHSLRAELDKLQQKLLEDHLCLAAPLVNYKEERASSLAGRDGCL